MKVLDLICAHSHEFEGWFGSEADFQSQCDSGLIEWDKRNKIVLRPPKDEDYFPAEETNSLNEIIERAFMKRILTGERKVVKAVADAMCAVRPELDRSRMAKPLAMLLFGMINWMFTWMKPEGELDYDAMAPIVADLFMGGLTAVKPPSSRTSD